MLISAKGFLISSGMPGKAVPPGVTAPAAGTVALAPPLDAGVAPPTGLPRVEVEAGAVVATAVVGLGEIRLAVVGAAVGAKEGCGVAVEVASPQEARITRTRQKKIIEDRRARLWKNLNPEK